MPLFTGPPAGAAGYGIMRGMMGPGMMRVESELVQEQIGPMGYRTLCTPA